MNTAAPPAAAPTVAPERSGSAPSPASSDLRFASIVGVVALAIYALLAWRHQQWRDELQAWAIVRDSPDLGALFTQLHYEGHPALWYLVLWLPARLTRSVVAMQVVHWLAISSAAFLFAWRAPFRRTTRVLVLCSYFPLFEYGMVARGYVLAWLLTITALAVVRTRHGVVLLGVVAALLANTTILAIPLAVGLVFGVVLDRRVQPTGTRVGAKVLAACLVAVGAFASLATAWPAANANHVETISSYDAERFHANGAAVVRALLPIPATLHHLWDAHFTDTTGMIGVWGSLAAIAVVTFLVRRRPAALATWLLPSLTVPFVLYTRGLWPSIRFCGVIFIAAIAALWLTRIGDATDRTADTAAGVLGALGCIASLIVVPIALATPFTAAADTADWVRANAPTNAEIVCDTAYRCSSVGIRLDRATRAADDPGPFTYAVFRQRPMMEAEPGAYARRVARETGHPVVLLTAERPSDPQIAVRAHFANSVVGDETYWVSLVTP